MRREFVWRWLYVGIGGDVAYLLVEVANRVTLMVRRPPRDIERLSHGRLRKTYENEKREEDR